MNGILAPEGPQGPHSALARGFERLAAVVPRTCGAIGRSKPIAPERAPGAEAAMDIAAMGSTIRQRGIGAAAAPEGIPPQISRGNVIRRRIR